jgi:Carboxypeptidase regulatory-like domain
MTARSLLCLLAVSIALLAQSIGAIEGQITDPSGAAVPAASVQTISRDTVIRNAQSDNQGRYRVSRLSAGDYKVAVTSAGFAQYQSTAVHIAAGRPHPPPDPSLVAKTGSPFTGRRREGIREPSVSATITND